MNETGKRVWFISGASAGFGRALSEKIIARGDLLVATARNPETLQDLVDRAPEQVFIARLDVTCQADICTSVKQAQERFGRIDMLINNAGFGLITAVEEASDEDVRRQFEVNFFGLAALTREVLPYMREQGSGSIINISSIAGLRGAASGGYYCASKFAVEGLSESLAEEVEPLGLRVLIVEPGPFRTDFAGRSLTAPLSQIASYTKVAEMRDGLVNSDGEQPGDPDRAAEIIIDVALMDNPPLRLVLGNWTLDTAVKTMSNKLDDISRSSDYAGRADYPDGE